MMPGVTGGIKPYLNYRNESAPNMCEESAPNMCEESAPPNMSELSRLAGIYLKEDKAAITSPTSSPKRLKGLNDAVCLISAVPSAQI